MRQLVGQSGSPLLEQTFDPFGGLLARSGSGASPYAFAGEWSDASGLQHLRARYYAPGQGRFTSRDPFPGFQSLPGTQHPYAYGLNNPVLFTDPSGEIVPLVIAAAALMGIAGGALGGLGYYGLHGLLTDPCFEWNWKEAAFWAGAGALMGAALGPIALGGWWIGAQAGLWGMTANAACGGDLCVDEAQKGLGGLSAAANYGINTYSNLRNAVTGTGLEVHHIVEQRFAPALRYTKGQTNLFPSIVLTPEEHQMFTNLWRTAIEYTNQAEIAATTTLNATPAKIWEAAQYVYKDYPALLNAALHTIFGQ